MGPVRTKEAGHNSACCRNCLFVSGAWVQWFKMKLETQGGPRSCSALCSLVKTPDVLLRAVESL